MDQLELLAIFFGIANILLLVRRSMWNYAAGLAMVTLYGWIFLRHRLYSDALLQIFFFLLNLYGWWNWLRGRRAAGDVVVARLDADGWLRWAALVAPLWAVWSFAMQRWTDAASPFWDGGVAVLSVTAQIMLARRLIDNWLVWILVDLLAIGLYASRGLERTAMLYGLFLIMSAWGWIEWRRAEHERRVEALA